MDQLDFTFTTPSLSLLPTIALLQVSIQATDWRKSKVPWPLTNTVKKGSSLPWEHPIMWLDLKVRAQNGVLLSSLLQKFPVVLFVSSSLGTRPCTVICADCPLQQGGSIPVPVQVPLDGIPLTFSC
jgi:hypothetical protein